jgi:hypothetical protein
MAPATSADDFRDLFDSKRLDGWVVEGPVKDIDTRADAQPGAASLRVEHDRGGVRRHPDHDPAQWPEGCWTPTSRNSRM